MILKDNKDNTIKDIEQKAEKLFYESFPSLDWDKTSPWKRELFRQTAKQRMIEEKIRKNE